MRESDDITQNMVMPRMYLKCVRGVSFAKMVDKSGKREYSTLMDKSVKAPTRETIQK